VPVAHACNPSYSGGRDQETHSSRQTLANSSPDPISKIPKTKKGWWCGSCGKVAAYQVRGPEFELQYWPKKKKKFKESHDSQFLSDFLRITGLGHQTQNGEV
jgi:hypothetical protein